jgi:hypothetical protein
MCVFITAVLLSFTVCLLRATVAPGVCVFITAAPIIKLFAWG